MEAGSAVQEETIPVVRRPFWVYRNSVGDELGVRRFNTAFEDLEKRFASDRSGPLGLAVLVEDQPEMEARPEAVWPDTDLLFAGYSTDVRQVRIRYFCGAKIGPGLPSSPTIEQHRDVDYTLEDSYRIELLSESEAVTPDDVLDLWEREGAVTGDTARRRVHQVRLVASTTDGRLAGVSTVFMERNTQLQMDMWSYRTFVASPDRMRTWRELIIRNPTSSRAPSPAARTPAPRASSSTSRTRGCSATSTTPTGRRPTSPSSARTSAGTTSGSTTSPVPVSHFRSRTPDTIEVRVRQSRR